MPNVTVGPEPPLDPVEDEPPPLSCDDEREEPDDPEDFPLDPPEYPCPPPGRASRRTVAEHTTTVAMARDRARSRGMTIRALADLRGAIISRPTTRL